MPDNMPDYANMLPFTYDSRMQHVNGTDVKLGGRILVLDVRAWGYFTGGGHGALGLPPQIATRQQDVFGQTVADMLNEKFGLHQKEPK